MRHRTPVIGLDLDNTIINYGELFYQVARERHWIPGECRMDKNGVRDYLQSEGRNDLWTELQGLVYGPYLRDALVYAGVDDFLHTCRKRDVPVWIISHKTRFPVVGSPYDLHRMAWEWLSASGLIRDETGGAGKDRVIFCETRSDKIAAIKRLPVTHFVDDLPEVFLEPDFPRDVKKYLYAPDGVRYLPVHCETVSSWQELKDSIFKGE